MSTYLYLLCLDHTPPLEAEGESGQHLHNLPQIRADIANRGTIVAAAADDWSPAGYFRRHTVAFLSAHPACRIGIRDEYGIDHPLEDGEDDDR